MKNTIIRKTKACVLGAMLAGTFYLLSAEQTAQAGQVLPPTNLPNCNGNNIFLSWSTTNGGSVQCQDPSPAVSIPNCPAGQYISGIQNGSPACSTAPSGSCPAGQVLVSVGGGGVTCASPLANLNANCPAGQVMVSINGSAPTCANPSPDISVGNCSSGFVMTGISNGSPVCTAASSLGGGGASFPKNHGLIGETNLAQGCRASTDSNGNPNIQPVAGESTSSHIVSSNVAWPGGTQAAICIVDTSGLSVTSFNGSTLFYSW